jgi:hypothetical protein
VLKHSYQQNNDFLVDKWYIPSKDLAKIYQNVGYKNITSSIIETCTFAQFVLYSAFRNGYHNRTSQQYSKDVQYLLILRVRFY